jgi:hypothetical protein
MPTGNEIADRRSHRDPHRARRGGQLGILLHLRDQDEGAAAAVVGPHGSINADDSGKTRSIIVLSRGSLLNFGNRPKHPGFVVSKSSTLQTMPISGSGPRWATMRTKSGGHKGTKPRVLRSDPVLTNRSPSWAFPVAKTEMAGTRNTPGGTLSHASAGILTSRGRRSTEYVEPAICSVSG